MGGVDAELQRLSGNRSVAIDEEGAGLQVTCRPSVVHAGDGEIFGGGRRAVDVSHLGKWNRRRAENLGGVSKPKLDVHVCAHFVPEFLTAEVLRSCELEG